MHSDSNSIDCVPDGTINNKSSMVRVMAWPLAERMIIHFPDTVEIWIEEKNYQGNSFEISSTKWHSGLSVLIICELISTEVLTSLPLRILLLHWHENASILTKFTSLAAPKVVILTTFVAASDENFVKMWAVPFQYIGKSSWYLYHLRANTLCCVA